MYIRWGLLADKYGSSTITIMTHTIGMMSYHAHFDCFSGAAGDMLLAACLDAADSLPHPLENLRLFSSDNTDTKTIENGHGDALISSEKLLAQITYDLENGMPELKGEFSLTLKRAWRSKGRIAARKVEVASLYNHEAAPVPVDARYLLEDEHKYDQRHNHLMNSEGWSHEHEHEHEHQNGGSFHSHDHQQQSNNFTHAHDHDHLTVGSTHSHEHQHLHQNDVKTHSNEQQYPINSSTHSHEHAHECDGSLYSNENDNHCHRNDSTHSHEHQNQSDASTHSHEHKHQSNGSPHSHEHGHQSDASTHSHEHKHQSNGSTHSHEHGHQSENESYKDSHKHSHIHGQNDQQDHEHNHSHDHDHAKKLRNLSQITEMLRQAPPTHIPPVVVSLSIAAFTELAHAEMHTHGAQSLDSVHFHEVGAVDSIVDTVGTLLALYYLGVNLGESTRSTDANSNFIEIKKCSVSCSRLPLGEGTVWTDHGLLPVPAPATMRLMVGMPTCPGPKGVTGELVTPTAAALLRVLTGAVSSRNDCHNDALSYWRPNVVAGRPPCFTPRAIGLGAGSKNFEKHPNILRLILGNDVPDQVPGNIYGGFDARSEMADFVNIGSRKMFEVLSEGKTNFRNETIHDGDTQVPKLNSENLWDKNELTHLQANIDDATPELLAHAIDLLLKNGATDAWITPVVMKKGRPAHILNVICPCESINHSMSDGSDGTLETLLLGIIFRHTTTLGIRIQRNILRAALSRKLIEVQLPYKDNVRGGKVDVKVSSLHDGRVMSVKAEFDHCKVIAEESGVPLKIISARAEQIVWDEIEDFT